MSRRFLPLAVMAVACWSSPLAGQSPDWLSRILSAAQLPISVAQARVEGTPSDEIRKVLDIMIGAKVPADEARDVIDEERAARRENGPVDNFGAFVQSQLKAGLRGRELAAAIYAEHEARGKGRGAAKGNRGDKGKADAPNGQSGRGRGNAGAAADKAAGAANGAGGKSHGARAHGDTNSASGAAANGRKPQEKSRPSGHPSQPNN